MNLMSGGPQLSYSHGARATALVGETSGGNLRRIAAMLGGSEAVVDVPTGRRWTYRQLDADTNALARGLLAAGVEARDRVGIWAPNCAEWVVLQYATAKIGAILVNINPAYRSHEVSYVLQQAGVRLLVSAESFKTSDYRAMIGDVRDGLPRLERVIYVGTPEWDALLATGAAGAAEADAAADGGAGPDALQRRGGGPGLGHPLHNPHTSGATGVPTGATPSAPKNPNNRVFTAANG